MTANGKTQNSYNKPYVTGKNPNDVIEREVAFTVEVVTDQIQIYKYLLCLINDNGRPASADPVLIAPETPVGSQEPIKSGLVKLRPDVEAGKVTAYYSFIHNTKDAEDAEKKFNKLIAEGMDLRTFIPENSFEGDSYIVNQRA